MQLAAEHGPQQREAAGTWEVRPGGGVWSPDLPSLDTPLLTAPSASGALNAGTEADVAVKVDSCLVFRALASEQFQAHRRTGEGTGSARGLVPTQGPPPVSGHVAVSLHGGVARA